ncbi:MAG: bifunctional adenosylcobinamide kinase/adenosylcobinamide-phosphate guanylyltransferase [Cyanobacteriota bacterium]|nr:bifunctional adenosylcobinamide kinase/adenosylcobinamide-phosphate guanylyltransferase [Cyanobacteriota bacterium]
MSVILITGPTRSGKSFYAESLAKQSGWPVIYVATSPPASFSEDAEWAERIRLHRQRRPVEWQTWEISHHLERAIAECPDRHCCLIDALGGWVGSRLDTAPPDWQQEVEVFLEVLYRETAQNRLSVIIVAEEVGWGVVPAFAMGRLFRDRLGDLTQRVAHVADPVYLVVAGYALNLKQWGEAIGDAALPKGSPHFPEMGDRENFCQNKETESAPLSLDPYLN